MPITPPNLDDRRYDDIVREARALIPQYCPEWTNLGDADPGMTLVQLFAWMTEMITPRLCEDLLQKIEGSAPQTAVSHLMIAYTKLCLTC